MTEIHICSGLRKAGIEPLDSYTVLDSSEFVEHFAEETEASDETMHAEHLQEEIDCPNMCSAEQQDVNFLKRKAAGQQQELHYQLTENVIL